MKIPDYGVLDIIDHEVYTAIKKRDEIDCVSDATNNIITAMREALLSDDVVEAAAKGMWNSDSRRCMSITWDEVGEDDPDYELKDSYRSQARAALTAAIEAVAGTEKEAER